MSRLDTGWYRNATEEEVEALIAEWGHEYICEMPGHVEIALERLRERRARVADARFLTANKAIAAEGRLGGVGHRASETEIAADAAALVAESRRHPK